MRVFDFRCTVCDEVQEKFVGKVMPSHCGVEMKKLITFNGALVFKGLCYTTEYGKQEYNLEPTDQARRAAREIKEAGIIMAKPGPVNPREIEQYQRRREAGI